MATRFELVLFGDNAARLRAAGEEAIAEIHRLHETLSAFDPRSAVSRINAGASINPVRISQELFELLVRTRRLSDVTHGAFDITVGPLLSIWGFRGEIANAPDETNISNSLKRVGMRNIALDPLRRTVRFTQSGMHVDLGGVGKGYALDVAADVLVASGVSSALLHGGTSSVFAIGTQRDGTPWKVAVRSPLPDPDTPLLDTVSLENESMSVSAVAGRSFEKDGCTYGHVIDPRSGYPVRIAHTAVAVARMATDADALSTGLLVLGADGVQELSRKLLVPEGVGSGFRCTVYD